MQKKTVSLSLPKPLSILNLPDEILSLIYCNLLNFEAKIFSTVCKKFFKISTSNQHLQLYLEDQVDINDVMRMKNIDHIHGLEISELCSISEKLSEIKINKLLQNLPHLRYLNLYYSNISGNTWEYLEPNPSLRELHLTGCDNLTGEGINKILNTYPNLISLSFRRININNTMFKKLESNTSLKRLDLSECEVPSTGIIKLLKKHPQLTHLNLSNTKITDNVVQILAENNKSLLSLSLRNTNITSKIFYFLASLTHLEKLEIDLSENNRLNLNEWLYSFRLNKVNINVIELVIGNEEAFNLVKLVASSLPRLKKLNLSGLRNISGLNNLLQLCQNLQELDLSSTGIKGRLFNLVPKLLLLKKLSLQHCTRLTVEGLNAILDTCPNLKELNLSSIRIEYQKLTSERLNTILEKCPDLERVILSKDTINSETLQEEFPQIKFHFNVKSKKSGK